MVSRVEYIIKKIVIFKMKENHLWRNAYLKSVSIVTKQNCQNTIFSFNLNYKCKSLFFYTHCYVCAIKILKRKIESHSYDNKVKNKVNSNILSHL